MARDLVPADEHEDRERAPAAADVGPATQSQAASSSRRPNAPAGLVSSSRAAGLGSGGVGRRQLAQESANGIEVGVWGCARLARLVPAPIVQSAGPARRSSLLRDLKVALLFLTRLPVRVDGTVTMRDLAAAVYAFPLVGAVVGLLPASPTRPPAGWASAPALGPDRDRDHDPDDRSPARGWLADTADGLGAGADRQRALAIMADSGIGSFGALALIFSAAGTADSAGTDVGGAANHGRARRRRHDLARDDARRDAAATQRQGRRASRWAGRPEPIRVMIGAFIAIAAAVSLLPPAAVTGLLTAAMLAAPSRLAGPAAGRLHRRHVGRGAADGRDRVPVRDRVAS